MESKTRLYKLWSEMKRRCNNPNDNVFKHYGGRGIKYTEEWEKFSPFKKWALENGYYEGNRGECTLDRIDVNGDYCPDNCRWVSIKQQAQNKRNSFIIEINGIKKTISEWAEESGIPATTIFARIKKYNYTPSQAVFTPVYQPVKDGIIYNGEMLSRAEWSRRTGIKSTTIDRRLKCGWTVEEALTREVRGTSRKENA